MMDYTLMAKISIHALREEGDALGCRLRQRQDWISIHALREEGDPAAAGVPVLGISISIHALREEGDTPTRIPASTHTYFYPRPPRGGRLCASVSVSIRDTFLSTPSARRATHVFGRVRPHHQNFYPRPPRGGRQLGPDNMPCTNPFLSTPSARRATRFPGCCRLAFLYFYPRPPRGGRPPPAAAPVSSMSDFYPRPPRGGRRRGAGERAGRNIFLSTPSARRATLKAKSQKRKIANFYPRPPRGGRRKNPSSVVYLGYFYPRPPRGGRRPVPPPHRPPMAISIHALREEGDLDTLAAKGTSGKFLSTPSARRATPRKHRARQTI